MPGLPHTEWKSIRDGHEDTDPRAEWCWRSVSAKWLQVLYAHQFGRSRGAIGAVLKEWHLIWALEEGEDFNKGDYGGGYSQGKK